MQKNRCVLFLVLAIGMSKGVSASPKQDSLQAMHKSGVGLILSSNGFGAELAHTVLKNGKLVFKLDGNYYNQNFTNKAARQNETDVLLNGFVKRGSIGVKLDYHPFRNSFKLSAGFSVLLNEVQYTSILRDSVELGNIKISPEEVGTLNYSYSLNPGPYFGIGFGRAIPEKRFGFSLDLGVFYTGISGLNVMGTNMYAGISNNQTLWPYYDFSYFSMPILPVASFGINYRLGKLK
ncbi:MAG: hypothetical protein CFE21_10135 [Bacteroidetes bacterium B1(2017)]|nr:MAG: hypothetical protein CFE21_10135 [Bacteroidetes bacterium B1(2017)]